MSHSSSTTSPLPAGIERGKKYRFIVKSAEEAIATLRERLGAEAKVLTVKQIDGQGLSRFLGSPKLEIVATVPELPEGPEKAAELPRPAAASPREAAAPSFEKAVPPPPVLPRTGIPEISESIEDTLDEPGTVSNPSYTPASVRRGLPRTHTDVWAVLHKAGFPETLLNSLHYGTMEGRLEHMPLPRALGEVNRRLRAEFQDLPNRRLTGRIAFFGTPGVGKTTALCKQLAQDVFIERKTVQVLKLDAETPNPDDALSVFCDVLGVPLLRDPIGPEDLEACDVLYVDLPGVPLHDRREWQQLRARLDRLEVATRVLVINGLYDGDLIGAAIQLGEQLAASHFVLTHLDELQNGAKLWPYLLRSGLSPLFASHGQNVTSDYSADVLRLLLEKTFPASLIN